VAIAAGVVVPIACYAALWWLGGRLRRELHAMRQALERFSERRPATEPEADIVAIDSSLTALGFPKPNPMLADE
ncbi:MAG TPA: hypothetical protein VEF03_12890, partial [Candidatus Binataceae bacterium]|nr:hypothetical protein [Candidatus Binataceae bacterium]